MTGIAIVYNSATLGGDLLIMGIGALGWL